MLIRLNGHEVRRRERVLVHMREQGLVSFRERREGVAVFVELGQRAGVNSGGSKFTYVEILAGDRKIVQHKQITPEHDRVLSEVRRSVMVSA